MIAGPDNLFALADFGPLLRDELDRVPEHAARQPNGSALLLQASAANRKLDVNFRHLPVVRLHVDGDQLCGDVRCAPDALPWEEASFRLIVVQHASDLLAEDNLAEELARVLMPGGVLLWFAMNPWSPWHAWTHWQARRGMPLPQVTHAETTRRRLLRAQLAPVSVDYLGACWPRRDRESSLHRWSPFMVLRGAYVLTASKQRAVMTPLRPRLLRKEPLMGPRLASPAQRARV